MSLSSRLASPIIRKRENICSHPTLSAKVKSFMFNHATSSQTPPASVIFFSANLLKYLARMTTGISGILPFPSTFEYPRGRRSRTGAVLEFFLDELACRGFGGTKVQNLEGVEY